MGKQILLGLYFNQNILFKKVKTPNDDSMISLIYLLDDTLCLLSICLTKIVTHFHFKTVT